MATYRFQVDVQPQFVPEQSEPERGIYTFAYTITVQNVGDVPAQLISRHWVITDSRGQIEEVKGLGVVGQQPLLKPGEGFEYTSACRLRTASGHMHGSYFCVAEDGERFEADIPSFELDASVANPSAPANRTLH